MAAASTQRRANDGLWSRTDVVRRYTGSELRPVETVLLARHRDKLTGRVLEIGGGGGRLTGHLAEIAALVTAIDISPHMLAALRERHPQVHTEERDLRDMGAYGDGSFEAVVAGFNIPDVLDHEERINLLDEIHRILSPGGMLIMSTHNRGAEHRITEPLRPQLRQPKQLAALLVHGRRWRRNRRRLVPHERRERDYSILNDVAHDFEALHYYIDRDAQERQLAAHGFDFVECLDLDGEPVPPGAAATQATELHYVARTPPATGSG
ncbi:MAG: class I SAM-dependent methyltransferase [Solirubrobacteraceae bacterium]